MMIESTWKAVWLKRSNSKTRSMSPSSVDTIPADTLSWVPDSVFFSLSDIATVAGITGRGAFGA